MTVAGREEGAPPPVDLKAERRNGEFVASLIRAQRVSAVHDLSDGGLAVALAEMAMAGAMGATIAAEGPEHAFCSARIRAVTFWLRRQARRQPSPRRRSGSPSRSRASASPAARR